MNDERFMTLAKALSKYLEAEKRFVKNSARIAEVAAAEKIARELFPDATIEVHDDPLQMGALILRVEALDITVRKIDAFKALIGNANNFEVYAIGEDKIRLSVLFKDALIRLP